MKIDDMLIDMGDSIDQEIVRSESDELKTNKLQQNFMIIKKVKRENVIKGFVITSKQYTQVVMKLGGGKEGELLTSLLFDILENKEVNIKNNCFTLRTSRIAKKYKKTQSRIGIAISELLSVDLIRIVEKESWDYLCMFNPCLLQSTNADTFKLNDYYLSLKHINKLSSYHK